MATIDLIILAVIVIYAVCGLLRGFVSTCLHTIASILSFLIAIFAARLLAPVLVSHGLGIASEQAVSRSADFSAQSAQELWDSMSGYLQNVLTDAGVTLETLQQSENPSEALHSIVQGNLAESIAFLLLAIVLFLLLSAGFGVIIRALNLIARLPVLHSCNALLGGLTGALTGAVLCTCVLWSLRTFVPSIYSDAGLLSPAVMQETELARRMCGWNGGLSLYEVEPQ
ncbi:MAG: CvpA family protein [Butyricicoccaceae bacterium]